MLVLVLIQTQRVMMPDVEQLIEMYIGKIQRFLLRLGYVVKKDLLLLLHGMEIHGIGSVMDCLLVEKIYLVSHVICLLLEHVVLQMINISLVRLRKIFVDLPVY